MKFVKLNTVVMIFAFGGLTLMVETFWPRVISLSIAVAASIFLGMLLEDAGEV